LCCVREGTASYCSLQEFQTRRPKGRGGFKVGLKKGKTGETGKEGRRKEGRRKE